jgi:chloramphenicol-sensitive protein RarD
MSSPSSLSGLIGALGAYFIWGLSPIYFKALHPVPPFQIVMHRMIWSFALLLILLLLFGRGRAFMRILGAPRTLLLLVVTTLLVSFNWFLFIWAINHDHILQTSLGYFICPLVSVFLGAVFLRERLRRLQIAAVALALGAVVVMTVRGGEFPWVALSLAVSFALYGLLRKTAAVEALEGLTMETLLLCLPASVYLIWLDGRGQGAFGHLSATTDLLLVGTALVTAIPLLLFNLGARRLHLTTIGFLQYLAPSCTFLLAVFVYHESFTLVQGWTFAAIWTALALFSIDAVAHYPRFNREASTRKPGGRRQAE